MDEYVLKLHENEAEHIERFYTYWLKQPNLKNHYYTILQQSNLVQWYTSAVVYNLDFENKNCTAINFKQQQKSF